MFPSQPPSFLVNLNEMLFQLERRLDANRWMEATPTKSGDRFLPVRAGSGDERLRSSA
jgi:hypothetical protein